MATGHRPWFGGMQPLADNRMPRGTAPQGGVVASAADLARYLAMMMNGRDDVLSAQGKSLMMRPASAASPSTAWAGSWTPVTGRSGTRGRAPATNRSRPWFPPPTPGSSCWSTGAAGWASGRLPACVTASRPPRWASIRPMRNRACRGRSCSSHGAVADRLPALHDLGLAAPGRAARRVGCGRTVQSLVPTVHHLAAAWIILDLVPRLVGSPLRTISLFQPDLVVVLIAAAVTGVLWAVFRLGVAYTARFGQVAAGPAEGRSTTRRRARHPARANQVVR